MAREQDTVAGAKQDTVVLLVPASPTVDQSQQLTDLTASGAGAVESPSARTALVEPRTVSFRWVATAAEASVGIVIHGNQAMTAYTWLVGTTGGGNLAFGQNGVILFVAAAALAAADYTVSWSLRANPDTTGAADAMISEFMIYDHTAVAIVELEQVTHAAPTTDVTWDLSWGGWYDGAVLQITPANQPTTLRVSSTEHPHGEAIEDWTTARTAYAGLADDAPTEPPGPIPVASGMSDAGMWAGRHPWGWTAAHSTETQRRNWCAPVNEVYNSTPAVNVATPDNWRSAAPDSPGYTLLGQFVRWVAVPADSTHARVRVHTHTDEGSITVGIRCYAFNRRPGADLIGGQPAPALEYYSAGVTFTRNDGGGDGTWNDLGLVRLPKFAGPAAGWAGTVHLVLAFDIDPADNEDISLRIKAWHAVPVYNATIGVFDP